MPCAQDASVWWGKLRIGRASCIHLPDTDSCHSFGEAEGGAHEEGFDQDQLHERRACWLAMPKVFVWPIKIPISKAPIKSSAETRLDRGSGAVCSRVSELAGAKNLQYERLLWLSWDNKRAQSMTTKRDRRHAAEAHSSIRPLESRSPQESFRELERTSDENRAFLTRTCISMSCVESCVLSLSLMSRKRTCVLSLAEGGRSCCMQSWPRKVKFCSSARRGATVLQRAGSWSAPKDRLLVTLEKPLREGSAMPGVHFLFVTCQGKDGRGIRIWLERETWGRGRCVLGVAG